MPDPLLVGLVGLVGRNSQVELPVVFLCRGLVVEGLLVGESRWFDEMALLLDGGSLAVQALADVLREAGVAWAMAAAVGVDSVERVHLLAASVRSGTVVVAVGLWRVDLVSVEGWKLGAALPLVDG